jgi:predicted ArsR family transcriptional regulator
MVRPAPGCPTCHGSGLISDARRTAFEAAKNVTRAMTVEEMAQTLDVHVDVVRKTLRILIEKGLLEGRPLSD